jgi:hypothetical protein
MSERGAEVYLIFPPPEALFLVELSKHARGESNSLRIPTLSGL